MDREVADGTKADADVRRAIRLEIVTVAWMTIEAVASLAAGIAAGSLLLFAFGADSIIEFLSAVVVLRRLWHEAHPQPEAVASLELHERKAEKIGGYLLLALSLYIVGQAGYGLYYGHEAETSWWGLAVAAVAAFGTPVLARAKLRIADRIGSRALRADAMETLTCGYLAWVLLGGLAANALLRWWWLDAAASLLIVPLLLREAKEALSDEETSH